MLSQTVIDASGRGCSAGKGLRAGETCERNLNVPCGASTAASYFVPRRFVAASGGLEGANCLQRLFCQCYVRMGSSPSTHFWGREAEDKTI